jgi:hypothetical protein
MNLLKIMVMELKAIQLLPGTARQSPARDLFHGLDMQGDTHVT